MKHNFNAGPCVLPKQAIEAAIEAIRDFDNTGIGILEISHRTPGWERIMAETEQLWRELLNIPEDYAVMFLGGGASTKLVAPKTGHIERIFNPKYPLEYVQNIDAVNEKKKYMAEFYKREIFTSEEK